MRNSFTLLEILASLVIFSTALVYINRAANDALYESKKVKKEFEDMLNFTKLYFSKKGGKDIKLKMVKKEKIDDKETLFYKIEYKNINFYTIKIK